MGEKSNDVYYVCIDDSHEVRRAILKASKEIIIVLQRFEMFKRLREAKLKLMEELSKEFKEIHEITSKMKIDLPKAKFASSSAMHDMRTAREREGFGERSRPLLLDKEDDELKRLEQSISEIEEKLQKME
jgi:valyl-tRNA synthetase